MASFRIEGGHLLSGEIRPQGAKNEALQVICATLLTSDAVTIHNIPNIRDVNNLIQLLKDIGVKVTQNNGRDTGTYTFQANALNMAFLESDEFVEKCAQLRGSVMKPESQTFTSLQNHILIFYLKNVVHRNFHQIGILRHQQVEIDGILDGRHQNLFYRLFVEFAIVEIVEHFRQFAFSFHIKMLVFIDEDTPDHIAGVVDAVVAERVGEEVEDMDDAAVGAGLVFADVRSFHHLMVAGKFEDVGVHQEDQHVAGEAELELVEVLAVVVHGDTRVLLSAILFIIIFKLFGALFEQFHRLEGTGIDLLFQFAFLNQ